MANTNEATEMLKDQIAALEQIISDQEKLLNKTDDINQRMILAENIVTLRGVIITHKYTIERIRDIEA